MIRKAQDRVFGIAPGLQLTESEKVQNIDNNVQAMRDQGIIDACHGYPAFAWFDGRGTVHHMGRAGLPESPGLGTQEHREAFAYARAYVNNR